MALNSQRKEDLDFDPGELKGWEDDPRGIVFWAELSRMFEDRISAVRAALHKGDLHNAVLMAGHLEAIEEIIQLPSVLIQEDKGDLPDEN